MKPHATEAEIQSAILQYLAIKKIFHWRQKTTGFKTRDGGWIPSGSAGVPDILVCIPVQGIGVMVGLEVKRDGGKLRPAQETFKAGLEFAGGFYYVVHSIDEVVQALEKVINSIHQRLAGVS